jgi:predicted alpha/beta superfamily hydrolase
MNIEMLNVVFWVGFVLIVAVAAVIALAARSKEGAFFGYWGTSLGGIFVFSIVLSQFG